MEVFNLRRRCKERPDDGALEAWRAAGQRGQAKLEGGFEGGILPRGNADISDFEDHEMGSSLRRWLQCPMVRSGTVSSGAAMARVKMNCATACGCQVWLNVSWGAPINLCVSLWVDP